MTCVRETAILCIAMLIGPQQGFAVQEPPSQPGTQAPSSSLTAGQLDSLVAPLALYPDPILSQVLVASTYPLEIVEASRWVKQNPNLKGKDLVTAAAKQPWDASVQAMVAFPDLLARLNDNLSWTTDLGNAFLAQQDSVMEAIQQMRQKASDTGALTSNPQQTVSTTTEGNQTYIEIQPANPEVVYVPSYDPAAVWGAPAEYPYPPFYYPPSTGAVIAAGAISFGLGVAVGAFWGGGWNNWGWHCGWGHNNVVINNNFINNNHFNHVNVANGNNWAHNPAHRGGVPYANRNVSDRFNNGNGNHMTRPTAAQTEQRFNQMQQRGGDLNGRGAANRMGPGNAVAPQGGGDRIGNRNLGGEGGRGAFDGMHQGGFRTQMNSNRGFGSRGGGGMRMGGGGRRR
jgi:hypothetical protein